MRAADLVLRSPTGRRLTLWAGLGAAALALTSLAAFAKDHALMINASPSLPYWAIWLDHSALPQRGDIILFDPPSSPLLERHFGKAPNHLIQMPHAISSMASLANVGSNGWTKLIHPAADGLVSHVDTAFSHQVFNITQAQRESEIQPHCLADDVGVKAMTLE